MENNYTKKIIAFLGEVGNATVVLNKENKFAKFKYADITSMLDTVNEVASKHGCTVLQFIRTESIAHKTTQKTDDKVIEKTDGMTNYNTLETVIVSEDGGSVSSGTVIMPNRDDDQKFGATSTYYRKFQLQALLGLKTGDDPEAEIGKDTKQSTPTAKPTVKKATPTAKPTVKKAAPKPTVKKTEALSDADVPPTMNNPFGS